MPSHVCYLPTGPSRCNLERGILWVCEMRSGNVYRVANITAATLEVHMKRTCVTGAADVLVAFPLQSGARRGRKENGFCFQAALWPCGLDGHLIFAGK